MASARPGSPAAHQCSKQQPSPTSSSSSQLAAERVKRYTLEALLATLAVAAIVTAIFVLLCPARITFSVARTGSSDNRSAGGGGCLELNLTLVTDNPSRHTKVRYESMFVDVSNSTAPGARWNNWVGAKVTTTMPLWQPGRAAAINVTVPLADAPWIQAFTGNMRFSVMVTAQVRFRVGVAWTRIYDIKVSCSPVTFPAKVKPAGAAAGASALPVRCV